MSGRRISNEVLNRLGKIETQMVRNISRHPIVVTASDKTLHAFPAGTPTTDIERYMWRYENGQDLPKFSFSPAYVRARQKLGRKPHHPRREDAGEKVTVTASKNYGVEGNSKAQKVGPRYSDFQNPGAVFDSREEAAFDVMNRMNTISKRQGMEYGWMYYTDPVTGKIGYSDPYQTDEDGGKINLPFSLNGAVPFASDGTRLTVTNTFGMGHTHGKRSMKTIAGRLVDTRPNNFSTGKGYDVEFMEGGGPKGRGRDWNYYTLSTPDNSFKEWAPEYRKTHPDDTKGEGDDFSGMRALWIAIRRNFYLRKRLRKNRKNGRGLRAEESFRHPMNPIIAA